MLFDVLCPHLHFYFNILLALAFVLWWHFITLHARRNFHCVNDFGIYFRMGPKVAKRSKRSTYSTYMRMPSFQHLALKQLRLRCQVYHESNKNMPLTVWVTFQQVVHGFDIDACQLLFDGVDVWSTREALRAWHTGAMLVQPIRQSPSYVGRLAKYSRRYGLSIIVPGLHPILRQTTSNFMSDAEEKLLEVLLDELAAPKISGLTVAYVRNYFQRNMETCATRLFILNNDGLARLLGLVYLEEHSVGGVARFDTNRLVRSGAFVLHFCSHVNKVHLLQRGSVPFAKQSGSQIITQHCAVL